MELSQTLTLRWHAVVKSVEVAQGYKGCAKKKPNVIFSEDSRPDRSEITFVRYYWRPYSKIECRKTIAPRCELNALYGILSNTSRYHPNSTLFTVT